jgi:hypothetical protein
MSNSGMGWSNIKLRTGEEHGEHHFQFVQTMFCSLVP